MEVQCIRIHPFIWRAEMDTGNVISVLLNDIQLTIFPSYLILAILTPTVSGKW